MDGINIIEDTETRNNNTCASSALLLDNLSIEVAGLKLLTDISFGFDKGSITGITGPNGSGKSTLLNSIMGFVKPCSGNILYYENLQPAKHTPLSVSRLGEGVSRSFQTPFIVDYLSVLDNVLAGSRANYSLLSNIKLNCRPNLNNQSKTIEAREILRALKLDNYAQKKAKFLSVGQRRKVCVARAIFSGAHIVLLDEPFANLDDESAQHLTYWIQSIANEGRTILVVEHRHELLSNLTNLIVKIQDARLIPVTQ